jgi:hypothetical protein
MLGIPFHYPHTYYNIVILLGHNYHRFHIVRCQLQMRTRLRKKEEVELRVLIHPFCHEIKGFFFHWFELKMFKPSIEHNNVRYHIFHSYNFVMASNLWRACLTQTTVSDPIKSLLSAIKTRNCPSWFHPWRGDQERISSSSPYQSWY